MTDESSSSDAAGTTDEQPQHQPDQPPAEQSADAMVDLSGDEDADDDTDDLPPSVKESLEQAVEQGTARRLDDDDPETGQPDDEEFQDLDDANANANASETPDTPDTPASESMTEPSDQASITDQPESEPTKTAGAGIEPDPPDTVPEEATASDTVAEPAPSDTPADADAQDEGDEEDEEIPNVSGEELDLEGLNEGDGEEEWSWGQEKPPLEFTYKGMEVVMTEPEDDDAVINSMRQNAPGDGDPEDMNRLDRLKIYVQLAVDKPNITDERWENHMTPTEKLTIGARAAQYLEGEDFTTGQEGGPSLPQG